MQYVYICGIYHIYTYIVYMLYNILLSMMPHVGTQQLECRCYDRRVRQVRSSAVAPESMVQRP